jgi:hypothetical protein
MRLADPLERLGHLVNLLRRRTPPPTVKTA